jgi:hypothetical protein
VLSKQDAALAKPPLPPPPPPSSRTHMLRTFVRKRNHVCEHLVKLMAHSSRGESMAIRGAWGELKATALMTPQPTPLAGPLTPDFVIATGHTLGLDVSADGCDHHLLVRERRSNSHALMPRAISLVSVARAHATGGLTRRAEHAR